MPEMQGKDSRLVEINPLRQLCQLGQSPWYDNIERRLFKTGEFAKLISEYGIMGVTSNPTIFDKAIGSSSDYDEQIRGLVKVDNDTNAIYDELAVSDISTAADMLLDIHKSTRGMDGYVSIEVLPKYAYDPDKTIEHARKIFRWINRKNILIKVPGTAEALPAIRQLIAEGINVNVTLLFSLAGYEAIARAYIDGLKRRVRGEEKLSEVTSVASIFVSRIDTKIDKMLEVLADSMESKLDQREILDLRGRAAVANSKMIYKRFKEIFFGGEFEELKAAGGNIQRVLWASTSTKNPNYRDVKYVEELIGPDSINTMPHQTLAAFYDHGAAKTSIENGMSQAPEVVKKLKFFGIDVDAVCNDLQKEGVKAFSESFKSLIDSINKKVNALK